MGSLIRMDSSEKKQIAAGFGLEGKKTGINTVVNRSDIIQQRTTVGITDGYKMGVAIIGAIDRENLGTGKTVNSGNHRSFYQLAVR